MLNKIKLGPKLIGGFVMVALVTAFVGVMGYRSINIIGNVCLPSVETTQEIEAQVNFIRAAERSLLLRNVDRVTQIDRMEERWKVLDEHWKEYESLSKGKEEEALWREFGSSFANWKEYHNEVINLSDQGKYDEGQALSYGKAKETADRMIESLNKLVDINAEEGVSAVKSSTTIIVTASILGFIIAFIVGTLLTISITRPIGKMVEVANKISVGDVEQNIDYRSGDEIGILADAFRQVTETLKNLVTETNTLSKAAVDGKLDTRGNTQKFQGSYRDIVQGVNDTLDAVIGPLNVAAEYVDRISKGDIPAKITDTYKGDFNEIKNNLNVCIDAVNALVADANMLSKAAIEGKLDTRADATKHGGDFRKIVEGVNGTLDSVIGPLNVAAEYVDRISKGDIPAKINDNYNGDFNAIKNNLNVCIDAVNALVADASMLSKAAVEGKLDTRADASKHYGDFKKIVEGVNGTLDSVIKPINEAGAILAQGAEGDMTPRIKGDYNGQLAELKSNTNALMDSLETALSQVNVSVDQVSSASGQIATGSQSLAEAASEQASSLEEISSSLEELSSMAKQNADNSNQAKSLSQEASKSAQAGNKAMEQMTKAIDKIKTSSDETAKIIKTIDEIAFQTNLLALNAAVEAARAGEAGKGFAVVAEEVRNLAQRSASAAKNTSDLIQQATENSNDGVKISEEVGKTFAEITQSVSKVNDLIAEISAASTEQSQGIGQINTAITDMDKMTQSSAANSEESASAAQELSAQVSELRGMVSRFKLNGNGHAKSEFKQSHVASLMSDSINMRIKKEKKKATGNMVTQKAIEQFPLDDSELAEF